MTWTLETRPSAMIPVLAVAMALLLGQSIALHSAFCADGDASASSGHTRARAADGHDGSSEAPFCRIYKNFNFESSLPEAVDFHAPAAMSDGESAHPASASAIRLNGFPTIIALPSLFQIKSLLL